MRISTWRKKKWLLMVLISLTLSLLLSLLWLQPRWLWAQVSPWLAPGAVYFVETQKPLVALTIDDGPDDLKNNHPRTTQLILDILSKYNAHATFFLIGSRITPDSQPLVVDMIHRGHELGNHLWDDTLSRSLDLAEFESQLTRTHKKILEVSQLKPPSMPLRWLRPGGGLANQSMMKVAQTQGYQVALGSVWPYDTLIPSSQFAVKQILKTVSPGAIIILHDHGKKGEWGRRTAKTLEQVLPMLQRRGLRVVTLSELMAKR
jgi:peptidoglycan-N-acetylglucosamine deacetylase